MTNDFVARNKSHENPAVFDARFSRCYRLLHFLACRILGGPEAAENAVENCRLAASRYPPRFEHVGAFRSWLVRVLIDEALALLPDNEGRSAGELGKQAAASLERVGREAGTFPVEMSLKNSLY
jgi:DNA-directed RNA polymerase specialized sigma24 family protein